jgi:hypothetical protein
MPLMLLLSLLVLLSGMGWLARARRLRRNRFNRIHEVLLQANVGGERFDPDSLAELPEPAVRYLCHTLAPGAPLVRSVDVRMTGSLRVAADDWVPFEARQRVCAGRGFLWQARMAALGRLDVFGADWLFGDEAGMEYALADWWPVLSRRGGGLTRSAFGRLTTELIWLPAALAPQRGARWMPGDTDRAVVTPAGSNTSMTVVVGADGRLREASIVRCQVAANGELSLAPYGVSIESEEQWGEFRVPSRLVAAWGIGTDAREDFLRITVEDIHWL